MQFMLQVPPESKPRFRSILEGAGRDCSYEAMFAELQEAVKSKKVAFCLGGHDDQNAGSHPEGVPPGDAVPESRRNS